MRHIQLSPAYRHPGWFGQFLYEGDEGVAEVDEGEEPSSYMVPVYQRMFDSVQHVHQLAGQGRELATAGLLHDVGKGRIPDEILFKPGPLDEDERRVMERHPVLGAQILLEHDNAGPMSIAAAWGHHLRYDRGGYPALPKWGLSSRVTALLKVCDVFEALTAVRPYKMAMTPRRAYEIMLQDRGAFDPGAFATLVSAMGLYPPGNRVRLSNGEQAIVIASGRRIDAPVVRVIRDRSGAVVSDGHVVRDLSQPGSGVEVEDTVAMPRKTAFDAVPDAHSPTLCTHPDEGTHSDEDTRSDRVTRYLGRDP